MDSYPLGIIYTDIVCLNVLIIVCFEIYIFRLHTILEGYKGLRLLYIYYFRTRTLMINQWGWSGV